MEGMLAKISDPLVLFMIVAGVGLVVMVFGFRFTAKTRTVVETIGAVMFHVGIFGIIYLRTSVYFFASLVALILALFILFDPLKIALHLGSPKIYKLTGWALLLAAFLFILTYLTHFPPALWTVPLVIYLSPYLIPSLKEHKGSVKLVVGLVVVGFLAYNGSIIYQRYQAGELVGLKDVKAFFASQRATDVTVAEIEGQKDALAPRPKDFSVHVQSPTQEPPQSSPQDDIKDDITKPSTSADTTSASLDEPLTKLQADHDALKKLYAEEIQKNAELKKEVERLRGK